MSASSEESRKYNEAIQRRVQRLMMPCSCTLGSHLRNQDGHLAKDLPLEMRKFRELLMKTAPEDGGLGQVARILLWCDDFPEALFNLDNGTLSNQLQVWSMDNGFLIDKRYVISEGGGQDEGRLVVGGVVFRY